ncbi:Substrate-specific component CbiM of cobalt ECF transporter [Clostridiaceae bacterium JG1575]|nr:Substrate-specific component CbiM of cobalt ECF transporter [Clostridiaceae bacterium JG1575]
MSQKTKKCLILSYVFLLALSVAPMAYAMHIMEGFLPAQWCIAWAVLCIPSLFIGFRKASSVLAKEQQSIMLLAMAGAFTFVLSALKVPSVTGSSSHMTGLGFAAILFGPSVAAVLGLIVLLFQALLLAHGGLTTLGANTFSMGVVGPLVAYGIYKGLSKGKVNKKIAIFFAAALGDLATYVITSIQLALAHPSPQGGVLASFTKFSTIFAVTQVPLAIIEGILTVVLINVIMNYGKDMFTEHGKELILHEQ